MRTRQPKWKRILLCCVLFLVCCTGLNAQEGIPPFAEGMVGVPYFFDLGAALGLDFSALEGLEGVVFTYSFTATGLPPGLTLNPNGQISGTPTTPGDYSFTVMFGFQIEVEGFSQALPPFPFPASIRVTGEAVSGVDISPGGISVSVTQGGAPETRSIAISNRGPTPQNFQASASVQSGQGWLSVSPGSGSVGAFGSASIGVSINAGNLPAGTYAGTVTVSVTPSGQTVPVAVVLTVSSGGQAIQISQTGLRFEAVQGAATPGPQTIQVLGAGSSALNFSVTAETQPGVASWLSATPTSGRAGAGSSAAVTVRVDPSKLQAGTYYGSIEFAAPQVDNSPQVATVVLTVYSSTTMLGARIQPTGLIFVGTVGGAKPAPKTVTVTNPSNGVLTFHTATFFDQGNGWFSVEPNTGTITSARPANLMVSIDSTGLAQGVYRGDLALTFTEDGTVRHVTVLLVMVPAAADAPPLRTAAGCTPTKLLPVSTMLAAGFSNSVGWPVSITAAVVDDCGDPLKSGSVLATFSNGDAALSLISLGDGSWSGTWQPQNVRDQVTITITAQDAALPLSGKAVIGGQLQDNPGVPIISSGGVVSPAHAGPTQPQAPGGFIAIYGSHLSNGISQPAGLPFTTQLGPTQAILGGRELPLSYASEGQVNAIVPYDVPVNTTQQLVVINGDAISVPQVVVIANAQPAVFLLGTDAAVLAVKPTGEGFLVDANHPASVGDVLVIYCAGLGAVDPPAPDGQAASADPLSRTTNAVTLTIDGVPAEVLFAGLAPGFAGLYQVNAYVPEGVHPSESTPLVLSVAGQQSQPVTIPVQ